MNILPFIVLLVFPSITQGKSCDSTSALRQIFTNNGEVVELETISLHVKHLDKKMIADAQSGKHFSYWVDSQDQIHFGNIGELTTKDSFLVLNDLENRNMHIIKEAGEFSFDPESKKYLFNQKKSWDLKPGEIDDAIRSQTKLEFNRKADPRLEKTRVMKCTEVMASRQRADNFLKDGMVSSAVVTIGSFATVEMISPGDKTMSEKLTLLTSDLIGNSISTAISSKVVKPLILRNANIFTDFAQRTSTDFATNFFVKQPIYNIFNSEPKNDTSENGGTLGNKLVPYDTGYSVIRFFPKRALERATVYTLPKLMIDSCLKNSAASFIIGPRSVRMLDRYAWGLVYMGGRKIYLNELDEENQK